MGAVMQLVVSSFMICRNRCSWWPLLRVVALPPLLARSPPCLHILLSFWPCLSKHAPLTPQVPFAAMLSSLLDKLKPDSMLQEDGLKKATMALSLLADQASDLVDELVTTDGGLRILVQTCVLHPVPQVRQAAAATLVAFIETGHGAFLQAALADTIFPGS